MTNVPHRCDDTRRALLGGGSANTEQELAGCGACRAFAARLDTVDVALENAAVSPAPLPLALRARILLAAAPPAVEAAVVATATSADVRIGRSSVAVKSAAAAAVLAAAWFTVPESALAADGPVATWTRLPAGVGDSLRSAIRVPESFAPPATPDLLVSPALLAAAAFVLLAASAVVRRR